MLGSAVSSSTPKDFHPNPHMGWKSLGVKASEMGKPNSARISRATTAGPLGLACAAVGMQRALDWAIGLPRSSSSALWILALLTPPEVSRYFIMPPLLVTAITTT